MPTGAWSPTAPQAGANTTPASPGTLAAADGSLGVSSLSAGSDAAGPGLGVQGFYGLETFGLNGIDNLQVQVNLANGNLVVHATDLKINAPGLNVRLDRFYNSRAAGSGTFGINGVLSTGRDVGLQVGASSVKFIGPSGFTAVFTGTSTFTAPPGINADLKKNADGTFALTYRKTGEKLSFTAGGYLTSDKDRNGVGLTYLYASDRLLSITDATGRVTTFAYANGRLSSFTDPAGRQQAYDYDTAGHLTRTTDPAGHQTTYTYNAGGQLTKIKTFAGTGTSITYDTSNRVTSVKRNLVRNNDSLGVSTTTFGYPSSTTTTQTDSAGHTSTYTLDSSGRVTAVKNALGKSKSRTWTANSDIASAVDALGATPSAGNTTRFTYDTNNNLTAVTTPTGAGAKAQYTNFTTPGATCSSTDTAHPYQAKCVHDGQGNRSSLAYTPAGNVASVADTSAASTGVTRTYGYQGDPGVSCGGFPGQQCRTTNGNAKVTTYAYNTAGQLTSITPPAPGLATTYGHDSLSRLTSVRTPNGVTVTYSYDNRDQRTQTVYSVGGQVVYSYDGDGYLFSMVDSVGGTQTYAYDGLNRQTSITPPGSGAVTVTYDTAGNLATYTDPAGTTTYTYDAGNELIKLARPGGSCSGTVCKCTTFGYNGNGARTTTTYPTTPVATVQTATLDLSGRPTRIRAVTGTTALSDLTYTYAKGSSDTALVQTRKDTVGVGGPANSTTTYGYDSLNRLLTATEKTSTGATNASWAYAYDKNGNRTSNTAVIGGVTKTTTQGYNAIDQLTSLNGSTAGLSYDRNGNQLTNPGNTAIGVAPVTASTVTGRDQITAATLGSGTHTTAGYLGETQTTMLTANNGAFTTAFSNTMLGLTRQTGKRVTASFVRTPDGQLIAATTGTSTGYFLTDNLGSTVGIVNTTGSKSAAYSYDPYGRTRTATGAAAATNAFRYAGGLFDTTTGSTKFGARYYDPNTGRFTQPDPSGQEQNSYAYAGNNPSTYNDPTGLFLASAANWLGTAGALAGAAIGIGVVAATCVGTAGFGCAVAGVVAGAFGGSAGGAIRASAGGGSDDQVATYAQVGVLAGAGWYL